MRPRRLLPLLVVALAILPPLAFGDYVLTILVYIGLSAIVALSLVLLTGKGNIASFGQAAYVGLGAYMSAWLTLNAGWSPWATLPLIVAVSAAASFFGAAITVRLSGHYLPLATISFGVAVYYLFGALPWLGGQTGVGGLPRLALSGHEFTTSDYYLLVAALLFAAMLGVSNLLDSREGRAIRALRNGVMAEAMGIDSAAVKIRIFVLACVMASVVGWFYAHFQQFVNPTPFSLNHGIEYLFMTVVGGAANLWGALVGAGLITALKPVLQSWLPGLLGQTGNFETAVFGTLIIVLFHVAPEGLTDSFRRRLGWTAPTPRALSDEAALPARAADEKGATVLKVSGARKTFGGVVANQNIGLEVAAGEILALIGPNGAGKSTFFNLVSGVLAPDAGTFELAGAPIAGLASREIASLGLSRTFQHVRLLGDMSAIENVAIGAHQRDRAGMIRAILRLDRAGEARIFAEARRQMERVGLGAALWTEAGALPLGQQRILEIARALAADPKILLLDEPAAGLRHKEKQELAALLTQLRSEGVAILLVEHDMDFVMKLADRIVVMEFGIKIAEGRRATSAATPR